MNADGSEQRADHQQRQGQLRPVLPPRRQAHHLRARTSRRPQGPRLRPLPDQRRRQRARARDLQPELRRLSRCSPATARPSCSRRNRGAAPRRATPTSSSPPGPTDRPWTVARPAGLVFGRSRSMVRDARAALAIAARRKAGRRQCRSTDQGADSPGRRLGGPIAHAQAHSRMSVRTCSCMNTAPSRTCAEHVRWGAPAVAGALVASATVRRPQCPRPAAFNPARCPRPQEHSFCFYHRPRAAESHYQPRPHTTWACSKAAPP